LANKVEVPIIFKPTKESAKKTKKAASKAGKQSGKSFAESFNDGLKIKDIAAGAFIGGIAADAVKAVAGAVADSVKATIGAAIRQEEAVNRLEASLQRVGMFSKSASQDLQNFASSLQRVTRFGDEAILEQLAFAQSLGATVEQSKQVVKAATDLSAAFNIDFNSAVRNVGRTLGGFAGELGEIIPELKNLSAEQLRAGEGITLLANKYRGFAEKDAKSFGGALDQLNNSWGDFLENIGSFITSSALVRKSISGITTVLGALNKSMSEPVVSARRLEKSLSNLIAARAKLQGTDWRKAFGSRIQYTEELKKLDRQIDKTTIKLRQARKDEAIAEENARKSAEDRAKADEKRRQDEIKAERDKLGTIGLTKSEIMEQQYKADLAMLDQAERNKALKEGEYEQRRATLEQQRKEQRFMMREQERAQLDAEREMEYQKMLEQEKTIGDVMGNMGQAFSRVSKSITMDSLKVANILVNTLSAGFGRAFQNMGKAIASGQSAMQAFVDGAKNIIADLASAFGDYFIKKGIALSLDPLGGFAFGGPLIAAGVGLKLLSGLLGGGGGASSASGAGGGGAGDFGAGADAAVPSETLATAEDREPETKVTVQVNGNIFDSDETGLRIAKILEEASLNQNVKVVGFA
jgi:hypothetical protein